MGISFSHVEARANWSGSFPFSQVSKVLLKPQLIKPWLISFSWGQALLRTQCSKVFQKGSFSPPLLEAQEDFPLLFTVNLVELPQYCGASYQWGPLLFLTWRAVCTEPPAIHQFSSPNSCSVFPFPQLWLPLVSAQESLFK